MDIKLENLLFALIAGFGGSALVIFWGLTGADESVRTIITSFINVVAGGDYLKAIVLLDLSIVGVLFLATMLMFLIVGIVLMLSSSSKSAGNDLKSIADD